MKEMKTISFNGQQYEIVDAKAREALNNIEVDVLSLEESEIDLIMNEIWA